MTVRRRSAWVVFFLAGACSPGEGPSSDGDATGVGGQNTEVNSAGGKNGAEASGGAASSGGRDGNGATGGADATGGDVSGGAGPMGGSASGGAEEGVGGEPSVGGDASGGEPSVGGDASGGSTPLGTPVEEEVAPAPIGRSELGVAALNDELYVMCGFTPSVTSSMQVYNPEADQWRDAADVPVLCHHPNVAVVDDIIYLLGFHGGSGQRVADGTTFAYDPMEDEWTERTPQPAGTERGASCVTTYQDKIYLFGGTNDIALADSSVYDPAQDTWEELPPLPAHRHHCIAGVVGDKIYILSGREVVIEEVQMESFVYDPVTQEYEEVAPIPTPRGGAAGGVLGGLIYVFGGEGNVDDPNGIFHEVEVYDPAADSWASLANMREGRHGTAGAVIGDRLYLPLGSTREGIEPSITTSVFYYKAP